jgi:hypothetical protein
MGWSLAAILGVAAGAVLGDSHVVEDARSPAAAAAWIAIAPKLACSELEALAAHRADVGLGSASIVPLESIRESFPAANTTSSICDFLESVAARGGAKFLLLVGDADTLPPATVHVGAASPCITDSVYAGDKAGGGPTRAVGRFPSSDAPLVRQFAERVVSYECDSRPAGWRNRISFLAASGGFGAAIDTTLDAAVSALLDRELPSEFDLRVLRPDAASEFGVARKAEKGALRDLWESGSLVFLYAGHGSRNGLHTSDRGPFTRTIFTTADANQLSIRGGSPFVMMFACNTTEFRSPTKASGAAASAGERHHPPSCLGEALLLNPKGAIAVLGASEVSHPYPDLLLAHEMNDRFRRSARMPIGEMVRGAKAALVRGDGEFQQKAASIAGTFGIGESQRRDLVLLEESLYNLLGDPALVLRAPDLKVEISGPPSASPGKELAFEVRADGVEGGSAIVSLEATRSSAPLAKGYPGANQRTLIQVVGEIRGGRFVGKLDVPATVRGRRVVLAAEVRTEKSQGDVATVIPIATPIPTDTMAPKPSMPPK